MSDFVKSTYHVVNLTPLARYRMYVGDFTNDRYTFQTYGLANASTAAKVRGSSTPISS